MKIENVQQAFEEFEKESVRVPDPENKLAKEIHPQIRDTLKQELKNHDCTFLSGSYSRRVQEGHLSDVDIIVIVKDPDGEYEKSAKAALQDIQDAASKSDLVRRTRKRVRAVKVFLHDHVFTGASPSVGGQEFTIDLVVARRPASGDGLLLARHLPDEGYDDWQLLNPEGQREAAVDKNDECDGMYIPTVRIVKHWNKGEGKPLRSYHAEAILWHALTESVDYDEAVVKFLDAAYNALAPKARTTDPGDPDSYVDDRFEDDERAAARIKVEKARKAAHEAYEAENVEDALEGWVKVFGSSFPASSTAPDSMKALLDSGKATAVGTGIQSATGRKIIRGRSWRKF